MTNRTNTPVVISKNKIDALFSDEVLLNVYYLKNSLAEIENVETKEVTKDIKENVVETTDSVVPAPADGVLALYTVAYELNGVTYRANLVASSYDNAEEHLDAILDNGYVDGVFTGNDELTSFATPLLDPDPRF